MPVVRSVTSIDWFSMRSSLVRLSLPLMIFLGVLLYAALMQVAKPSAGPMHVAGPAQNGFTKPEIRVAGSVRGGFVELAAGPHSTPLTIPYIP